MAKNVPKIDYVGVFCHFRHVTTIKTLQKYFYLVEEVLSFDLVGHMWKLVKNWFQKCIFFLLNTWLRTIYCLQTIHETACVILTLFQFFDLFVVLFQCFGYLDLSTFQRNMQLLRNYTNFIIKIHGTLFSYIKVYFVESLQVIISVQSSHFYTNIYSHFYFSP